MYEKSINKLCQLSESLISFALPLKELSLEIFTVLINYDNGYQINLSNRPSWIKDYYHYELYKSSLFDKTPSKFQSGYKVWSSSLDSPVLAHGAKYFNSQNGITICERHCDHTSFYFFSGEAESTHYSELFLNHSYFFQRYIKNFLYKKSDILNSALNLGLVRPSLCSDSEKTYKKWIIDLTKQKALSDSIEEISKQYALGSSVSLWCNKLSKRQKEVLFWRAKGKKNKQISKILSISPRTVDRHFEEITSRYPGKKDIEIILELLDVKDISQLLN